MAISKVVYGEETLIDLTEDTVDADSLALGISAHSSNGEPIVGLAPKTWTGTKAQYETEKSDIPFGTIVNITDDYEEGGDSKGTIYSDEERVIGTWFGKTLYGKVITKSNLALPSYSASSIDVNMTSDIGTNRVQIINSKITVYDSSSGQWASVACQIAHTVGTDSYKVKCLDSWGASSGRYVYFILEYTKD